MREITSFVRRGLAVGVVALAMTVGLTSVGAGSASARSVGSASGRSVVGQSDVGTITSKVSGRTANGDRVKGTFTPTKFLEKDGVLSVQGFLSGKIVDAGPDTKFSGIKTFAVKTINGTAPTSARAGSALTCDVRNLVLGPLDLNLLGLKIHLDKVVLNITAVAGAGALLGNLLCAVVGLLDGGPLAGLLGQLSTLLNQILGALNLGI